MTDSTAAPSQSGAGDQSGAPAAAPVTEQKPATVLSDAAKPADGAAAQPDAKPADAKQDDGAQPDTKDDGKPQGAPETYAEFTVPEGVQLDKAAFEQFVPLAKELNLPQEQAQKVVDLYASKILPHIHQQLAEAKTQQIEQWLEASSKDPEIGGAKFDANVDLAKKALNSFGTQELKAALDDTGLGNHPEVIRLLANIGRRISEDGAARTTGDGAGAQRNPADVLYGNKT